METTVTRTFEEFPQLEERQDRVSVVYREPIIAAPKLEEKNYVPRKTMSAQEFFDYVMKA